VARGPALAARLAGRRAALAGATGAVAAVWTVALAAAGGWDRVTAPLTTRHEYEPFAARVTDIGQLVRGYAGHLTGTPVHVQGHPPGPVVLAWALDRIGLGGAGWLAALAVAGWGLAAAAAVWAVGIVAGHDAARRAAPVLAVLPAAVWAGTSMDALFAGVLAVAVALGASAAVKDRSGLAAAAGVGFGLALLMTYGAGPFVAIVAVPILVLAPADRRRRLLVATGAGLVAPLAVAAAAGFWWPAGLVATGSRYWAGVAGIRPALYATVLGNPAALALAVGPAVAVGIVAIGRAPTRAALLPAVVLAGVVVADLSQMSRGEVERIWLPFVPWLALAGAAPGDRRSLLALQVSTALVVQSALASPW
jgi:methylthioxylose transferase